MDNEEIYGSVCDVCSEILGVPRETIVENSQLRDDLGADSLDFVELVMALEDRTKISISEGEFKDVKTVEDVVAIIARHVSATS